MPESLQTDRLTILNPLERPDWDFLLASHPENCFFHGAAWARVLHQTYGHQPLYLCRISEGRLNGLLPIMEVSSRLSGRRGVSLPFSDFCSPLRSNEQDQQEMFDLALDLGRKNQWRYFESRLERELPEAIPSVRFFSHRINLKQGRDSLFKSFDDSTRRGIRKAEKAGLQIEFGSGIQSIQNFYSLHCQTRRRHGLPPQPFRFFENIAKHVLSKEQGFVATVLLGHQAVAAAVFFHNQRQVIYKFGASNFALQHLRPNNFLMGEVLQHCVTSGFQEMHLGRTSLRNEGLRRFKLGVGASEEILGYYKYDFAKGTFVTDRDRARSWVNGIFRLLPLPMLCLAGRKIYPHLS